MSSDCLSRSTLLYSVPWHTNPHGLDQWTLFFSSFWLGWIERHQQEGWRVGRTWGRSILFPGFWFWVWQADFDFWPEVVVVSDSPLHFASLLSIPVATIALWPLRRRGGNYCSNLENTLWFPTTLSGPLEIVPLLNFSQMTQFKHAICFLSKPYLILWVTHTSTFLCISRTNSSIKQQASLLGWIWRRMLLKY